MANQEHLKILRQGVEIWNRWREENPKTEPDLAEADLRAADLSRANLRDASFFMANLRRANLTRTDLKFAQLAEADLSSADLAGADLSAAILTWANLTEANLTGANLFMAQVHEAKLIGTRLDGADLGRTNFRGTELARIVDLDLVALGAGHEALASDALREAPWIRVFIGSRGQFDSKHDPEDDSYWLIRQGDETIHRAVVRRLAAEQGLGDGSTVEFSEGAELASHVFISYVRENEEIVDKLCADLEAHGIQVWRDRDRILPGQRWQDAIRSAIKEGAFFIACFSREYLEKDHSFMNEELTLAIEELRQKPTNRVWFIPALLSDCTPPARNIGAGETIRDLQWVNLNEEWARGIGLITKSIRGGDAVAIRAEQRRGSKRVGLKKGK